MLLTKKTILTTIVTTTVTEAATGDIIVSGPGLAQHAFEARLVDDVHVFVFPLIVGGGKSGLPRNIRFDLWLLDEQRFGTGVVQMHLRIR
jgi:dihydrofolate reductase